MEGRRRACMQRLYPEKSSASGTGGREMKPGPSSEDSFPQAVVAQLLGWRMAPIAEFERECHSDSEALTALQTEALQQAAFLHQSEAKHQISALSHSYSNSIRSGLIPENKIFPDSGLGRFQDRQVCDHVWTSIALFSKSGRSRVRCWKQ